MSCIQNNTHSSAIEKKLIFSCSGSCNTGEIADRVARKLNNEGIGEMSCLAGIGGWINWMILETSNASKVLVIDGCQQECAKRTLEHSGFNEFDNICLTDLGFEKGKTPVSEEIIEVVACKIKNIVFSRDA